ncbi:MAG: AAA family ATPase [Candidatus Margulisiibacteriota bacterium]|nr:AAA family ATPase [Candidatus Margulisiibacteriota bacterium]
MPAPRQILSLIDRFDQHTAAAGGAKIELNDRFKQALELLENTGRNVFITGRAGTGKSTLLEYFRLITKKRIVVLAPTGVAALNVKGETIHSFFRFKPDITLNKIKKIKFKKGKKNIYKGVDAVVIDEISMARSDLLDCVDKFLRLNGPNRNKPFGGVQMIFIGDLYQLPPVVTGQEKGIFKGHYDSEYFFDARSFSELDMEYIELEKVYRQKDEKFIALLNAVRNNSAGDKEIALLNKRLDPDYEPKDEYRICLTPTNRMAKEINERRLARLKGKAVVFQGEIRGDFELKRLPTERELALKKGAQVMMLNNDSMRQWVNGTLGVVSEIGDGVVEVELEDGGSAIVEPYKWEIFHFTLDGKGGLATEPVGSFTQLPMKLAWAVTIHKSQGKTFDRVIIDLGRGTFAHGQLYVALSRCRSLAGIVLKKPVKNGHILMDWRVVRFVTGYQYQLSEKRFSFEDKIALIEGAIKNRRGLEITYLKAQDVKSKRTIEPLEVGEMEYKGKPFIGLRAFCRHRREERCFRVDRMLEIKEVDL